MCVCCSALSAVDMFFAGAKTLLTSQRSGTLMEMERQRKQERKGEGEGHNKMLLQLKLSNDSGGKVAGKMEARGMPSTDKHKAETMRKIVRH